MSNSVLFRARVPADRFKKAEKVFAKLGMKTSDAFNIFLAQVDLDPVIMRFRQNANLAKPQRFACHRTSIQRK